MAKRENCKVCLHDLRLEIETWRVVDELSFDDIVDKLKTVSPDVTISKATLSRHFEKHMDAKREVQIRYISDRKKQNDELDPNVCSEVGVKLRELKHLDNSIKEANDLVSAAALEIKRQLKIKIPRQVRIKDDKGKETGEVYKYDKVEVSHSVVALYKGASEELRQSAKTKMEILGIDAKAKQTDAVTTLVDVLMRTDED